MVRMAYKLGYHRDGEALGLEPFETEMRRRVWAQVVIQDTKFAFLSGLTMSSLPPRWDTKPPQNVNDADLIPGSKASIIPREGPTEMAFCHVLYLVYRFRIQSDMESDASALEAAMIGLSLDSSPPEPFDKIRAQIADLDKQLADLEAKYLDARAGNVHRAALTIRPMLTNHLDDLMTPPREQQEWGTELFNWKDSLFKLLVVSTESQVQAYDQFAACGFEWYPRLQLFPDFVAAIAGQLCQRPLGSLSDRAWKVVEQFYIQHKASLLNVSSKQVMLQAQLTLSAWEARVTEHEKRGRKLDTPDYIHLVRRAIAEETARKELQKVQKDEWDLMQFFDMGVDDFSENVVTNIYGL